MENNELICYCDNVTKGEIIAAMEAGARRVYLIEEPFAAGLGAGLDLSGPNGFMVVDLQHLMIRPQL